MTNNKNNIGGIPPKTYTVSQYVEQSPEHKLAKQWVRAQNPLLDPKAKFPSEVEVKCIGDLRYCSCSESELRHQIRQLEQKIREIPQPISSFRVQIINSSGRGLNGGGQCVVDIDSRDDANNFYSQVRNGWVSHEEYWSPSGTGFITPEKREKIIKAVKGRVASRGGGGLLTDHTIQTNY